MARALFGAAVASVLIAGMSCQPLVAYDGDACLDFSITIQPQGGNGINTVTCSFFGQAREGGRDEGQHLSQAISLSAVWHSSHSTYDRSDFVWTTSKQIRNETVSKSAPEGMYLDKDFWVEFYWEDADGAHSRKSAVARCR
jgi:hypothetical protein